jgi:very-short-patch-repair endonuclease
MSKKKWNCIDCNKEVSCNAKRCKKCPAKERANRPEYKKKVSGKNSNFYIDGRNNKGNYCIDCGNKIGRRSARCNSCSTKRKWDNNYEFRERMNGENHPNWKDDKIEKYCVDCGVKISPQSIARCNSCSNKRKWENPKFRENNKGSTGHKHTKKTKKKMRITANKTAKQRSEFTKQCWKNGSFDGVFKSPSKPEKKIMKILEELKIEYVFQYRPNNYSRPYDFYIPNMNTLIEYDSKYWHSLHGRKKSDQKKTDYANKNGYNLLRFNEDNLDNFKKIIKRREHYEKFKTNNQQNSQAC